MKRTRPLPPGGLEQALYDGKRRRRHAVLGGGGVTAAVVAVVLVAVSLQGSPARSSLQITNSPEPSTTATGEPFPSPDVSAETSVSPSPGGPEPTTSPDCSTDVSDCYVDSEGEPTPGPTLSTGPSTARTRPVAAYRENPTVTRGCGEGGIPGTAYCNRGGPVVSGIPRGSTFVFEQYVCVHGSSSTQVLAFTDGQEHELVITRVSDGAEVYRFSKTVTFTEGAHQRTAQAGTCVRWDMPWDTGTTAGPLVEAGRYHVSSTLLGLSAGSQGTAPSVENDYDFDVYDQ